MYARWTAKRDRQMVKKYKDEEGITLELDGLGAREIKAAIIKRDEKETEEALSELVSHRNVAVVLVKPPLSGDARVVRKIHEHLEDTLRFDVVLTMVSGDRVNGWSEEDRKDAETLCGGVGVCSRPKPTKKKAEAKEATEAKEAKEGDVAKGTKNKTDNKGTAGKGDAKEGHEGVIPSAADAARAAEEALPQPESAVFVISWDGQSKDMPSWKCFREEVGERERGGVRRETDRDRGTERQKERQRWRQRWRQRETDGHR